MMVILIIPMLLWLVNYAMMIKYNYSQTLIKSFECGFEHHHWVQANPSLHFFKLGLVFVIFDLELTFVLGLFYNQSKFLIFLLLMFLWVTLWLEYVTSSLTWNV